MLRYARAHLEQTIHSLVLGEFRKSGITQKELAARLGHRRSDQVCRYLSNPGNWKLDTVADLLFAATGTLSVHFAVEPTREAHSIDKMNAPEPFELVYLEGRGRISAPMPPAHEETHHHVVMPPYQAPPSYA
jgi:hypothetical protein